MDFRRVTMGDRNALLSLLEACYLTWNWDGVADARGEAEATVTHLLDRLARLDWTTAAWDGHQLVGLTGFSAAHLLRGRGPRVDGRAQLNYLYCHPTHWGTGLSGTLHDECVSVIGKHRYEDVQLWAPVGNPRARRFYEARGWSCVGGRIRYQGSVNLVRYFKRLPATA